MKRDPIKAFIKGTPTVEATFEKGEVKEALGRGAFIGAIAYGITDSVRVGAAVATAVAAFDLSRRETQFHREEAAQTLRDGTELAA